MFYMKKAQRQVWSEKIYSHNTSLVTILENTPVLSKSRVLDISIVKNVLHYNTDCKALSKKLKYKKHPAQAGLMSILTQTCLKESKISICKECLGTKYILGASTDNFDNSYPGGHADLAYFMLKVLTTSFFLKESKERSISCNFEESLEELFQDLKHYKRLLHTLPENQVIDTCMTANILKDIPLLERNYLQGILDEAEKICKKMEDFLKDEKVTKRIQQEFVKLVGDTESSTKSAVLHGSMTHYQFKEIHLTLDTQLCAEPSYHCTIINDEKIAAYYKLIELAVFNQITSKDPSNFAVLLPSKAAADFLELKKNYHEFDHMKIDMQDITEISYTDSTLVKDTMQIAYSLWEANDFTEDSYKPALKAALLMSSKAN